MKANTVKNDMVEASSEAELRTSEQGMGLGIDVVGGGEAEVTLKTRAGWHFANGASEQTVYKSRGATVLSLPLVGDNSGAESGGQVPVGGTEDPPDEPPTDGPSDPPAPEDPEEPSTPEDPSHEEGSVEHTPPVLALSVTGPRVVAYYVLDGKGMLSVTLTATLLSEGVHDPDGEKVKFSPDSYHWEAKDAKGAILASQDTEDGTAKMDVWLSRNGDVPRQTIVFSVVGECDHCGVNCDSSTAEENFEVSVYELSIDCDPYLGLDMTDAGRENQVSRTATVKAAPGSPSFTVNWVGCGDHCEFVDQDSTKKATVRYQNKPEREPSKEWRGEKLEASVRLSGMEESVSCVTNFTVVKVDVTITDKGKAVGETDEESKGALVKMLLKENTDKKADDKYMPVGETGLDGEPSAEQKADMCKLTIKVEPYLRGQERLDLDIAGTSIALYSVDGSVYEKVNPKGSGLSSRPLASVADKMEYTVCGVYYSMQPCDGKITVCHKKSGAVDRVSLTSYRIRLITPAGDPVTEPKASTKKNKDTPLDGQNEFTFYDVEVTGRLKVFVKASIRPAFTQEYLSAYPDVASRLTAHFAVEKIEGKAPSWRSVSGCEVGEDGSVKMNAAGVYEAVAEFYGYPERNIAFGKKSLLFTCDGGGTQIHQAYELFYQKNGINHNHCNHKAPNGQTCKNERCPNWFYYWKEGGALKDVPNYVLYGGTSDSLMGCCIVPNEWIELYDLAAKVEKEKELPAVTKRADGKKWMFKPITIGANRKGLACCAAIVAHELYHGTIYSKSLGKEDVDADRIADSLEADDAGIETWVLNKAGLVDEGKSQKFDSKDTYNMAGVFNFSAYASYGDNEVRARIIERLDARKMYDRNEDWSNPGFNSMNVGACDEYEND